MRTVVKIIVWTAGLAMILGMPSDTFARYPIFAVGKTYCTCDCYAKDVGVEYMGWENVGTCTGANGKACKFKRGGKTVTGTLQSCDICKATQRGLCDYTAVRLRTAEPTRPGTPPAVAPERQPRPPARSDAVPPRDTK